MKIEEILIKLRENGLKVTKYRKALLNIFLKHAKPLSVHEILELLSQDGMAPNKTTIYREIDSLVELKYLESLDFGDERKRYELSSREHHHHLICESCKRIEDIVIKDDIHEIEKKLKVSSTFKIKSHTLEFFGICGHCQ